LNIGQNHLPNILINNIGFCGKNTTLLTVAKIQQKYTKNSPKKLKNQAQNA
jgi:hypothetical protein